MYNLAVINTLVGLFSSSRQCEQCQRIAILSGIEKKKMLLKQSAKLLVILACTFNFINVVIAVDYWDRDEPVTLTQEAKDNNVILEQRQKLSIPEGVPVGIKLVTLNYDNSITFANIQNSLIHL